MLQMFMDEKQLIPLKWIHKISFYVYREMNYSEFNEEKLCNRRKRIFSVKYDYRENVELN